MRPYTPVDQNLAAASQHSSQESDLYLMIKIYPDGMLSSYLNSLHIGKSQSQRGKKKEDNVGERERLSERFMLSLVF